MSYLAIEGGQLFYELHGAASSPTVMLVHGFGMAGVVWEQNVSALTAAGYSVVTYDQRCCGQSDKNFADVSIPAMGDDIVALCDELGLSSVILNGWSLGGALVVDAAGKLADRLKGLILTGGATPRYTQADGFPHGGTAEDVVATVAALRADRSAFLKGLYFEGVFAADVGESVKQRCLDIAMQESPEGDAALGELGTVDQREQIVKISCPSLVLHGAEDGVVPIGIGEVAASLLQNSEMTVMAGCGHAPFLEDIEAYNRHVISFLGRCAE
jgi:pimeloyl-[acyl-carrier protein] methyl ester esterase